MRNLVSLSRILNLTETEMLNLQDVERKDVELFTKRKIKELTDIVKSLEMNPHNSNYLTLVKEDLTKLKLILVWSQTLTTKC